MTMATTDYFDWMQDYPYVSEWRFINYVMDLTSFPIVLFFYMQITFTSLKTVKRRPSQMRSLFGKHQSKNRVDYIDDSGSGEYHPAAAPAAAGGIAGAGGGGLLARVGSHSAINPGGKKKKRGNARRTEDKPPAPAFSSQPAPPRNAPPSSGGHSPAPPAGPPPSDPGGYW